MYGTYLSASGADSYSRYLEVIANNVANVDTPGFRRELPVIKAFHSEAIEQGLASPGDGGIHDLGGGVGMFQTVTSFEIGQVQRTGVDSDVMLADPRGDHFFVVDQDGQQMLTRAGNFLFDKDGYLVTQSGRQVMSSSGGPVRINPALPYEFDSTGNVVQPATGTRAELAVVRPTSLHDLQHMGENMFAPNGQLQSVPPEERRVRAGFLETSAARPVQEMVDMIKVTKAYEANVRMIQQQDGITESLLTRVLRG
ncbi:MAG: flagellar hook-basal body complex protein [Planctomycetaceae bacterium]|nr:flagellar hook-basal body complex protein [Planctomycetaceae bacterium]